MKETCKTCRYCHHDRRKGTCFITGKGTQDKDSCHIKPSKWQKKGVK